jgi:hypothetical protein
MEGEAMRRKTTGWVIVWVMMWSLMGWAEQPQNPHLTVFVAERAATGVHVLAEAERMAARVFRQAGVDVEWMNCDQGQGPACDKVSQADLVVHLVPRAHALSGEIFGVAYVENNAGVYADVFFDSIQSLRRQVSAVSLSPVLGSVLAHEVGHLLLGTNAHSREGIMQAHWQAEQLDRIAKGQMRFTKEQSGKMRARVESMHANRGDESVIATMVEP